MIGGKKQSEISEANIKKWSLFQKKTLGSELTFVDTQPRQGKKIEVLFQRL